jgi:CIC family chloride channel protein
LPVELTYAPLLAATVTLGFGGSAGSEGPIAYSGGAIGSNFGQRLRLPTEDIRYLTAIGAAAGIAGNFKAPIGGALFAIEILGLPMTGAALCGLFTACLTSSSTAVLLSATGSNIPAILHPIAIESIVKPLPIILLFGLFCGLYSRYFSLVMHATRKALERISAHWLRCLAAGTMVGLAVLLLPGLYGEGYNIIQLLLTAPTETSIRQFSSPLLPNDLVWPAPLLAACGMLLLKGIATSATTNGGGVAGDFAPTIMIGAVAGFLFATIANSICNVQLTVSDFVLMGMAGVLAGVVKAPLMATFLITETATMGGGLLLPVAIVAYVSYLVVRVLTLIGRKKRSNRPNDDCRDFLRSDSQE